MNEKYYEEFDILKGFGIIFVFLGHSFILKGIDLTEYSLWNKYIYDTIYSFHMPLFFFVAGFLSNKNYDIKKFYISKIKRLAIPYIFINIIDCIVRKIFSNLVNTDKITIKEILLYGGKTTWFIYTLFWLFILFPVIDKYIYQRKNTIYFILFLMLINIFDFKLFNMKMFSLNKILYYLIYFSIGYLLKDYYLEIKEKVINNKKILIIFIIVFLFQRYFSFKIPLINLLIPVLGTIIFLILSEMIKEKRIVNFFIFYGKNSLVFYLLEGFVLVIVRSTLIKIVPIEQNILFVSLYFILKILIVSIIIKCFVNKSKILSFLLGSKI